MATTIKAKKKGVGPTRTPEKREKDFSVLAELYVYGHTQREMAEKIGVSQTQISFDISELHQRWVKAQLIDVSEAKARELAKIDNLERIAIAAWIKSGGKKRKVITTTGGEYENERIEQWEEVGDPAYLARISWCIERRCKILGIDAPEKVEIVPPSNSLEELQAEAQRLGMQVVDWKAQLEPKGN